MRILLVIISSLLGSFAVAQYDTLRTHIELPDAEVAIEAVCPDPFLKEVPDRLLMQLLPPASVGDILALGSTMNVRTYGPAGTAVTANGRGLSGDHVNVLWNGIPIQSPSLGLADLGALPASLFDQITILRGARSGFVNSGGAAGTLWLDSREPTEQQSLRIGYDDLLNLSVNGKAGIALGEKWHCSTTAQVDRFRNEFAFNDPLLAGTPELNQRHNNYNRSSLMQQFTGSPAAGLTADAAIWVQQSYLHIPEILGSYGQSFATQRDSALRVNAGLKYESVIGTFSVRAAFFEEGQHYRDRPSQDAPLSIDSRIRTSRHYYRLGYARSKGQVHLRLGYDIHRESAHISAYSGGQQTRLLHGPQASLTWSSFRYLIDASGRYDIGAGEALPVVNLRMERRGRILRFFAAIKNTFRYADLNELYWQPGGNPDLMPERGYSAETGLALYDRKGLSGHIMIYGQRMRRLISWEPGEQGWRAQNRSDVEAAGVEGLLRHRMELRNHSIDQNLRANIQVNSLDADILTKAFYPAVQLRYGLQYRVGALTLGGVVRFVSNAFTYTRLNADFGHQDALLLADAFAGYRMEWLDHSLLLSLAVRNAGDVMDFRVARTAAPGRVISLNLQWTWNTSNNR